MQRVTLVRYTAKPDRVAENERLARAVFAELRQAAPPHIAYALFRNGTEFVHLFINTRDDDASALLGLAGFKAYAYDTNGATNGVADGSHTTTYVLVSSNVVVHDNDGNTIS